MVGCSRGALLLPFRGSIHRIVTVVTGTGESSLFAREWMERFLMLAVLSKPQVNNQIKLSPDALGAFLWFDFSQCLVKARLSALPPLFISRSAFFSLQ